MTKPALSHHSIPSYSLFALYCFSGISTYIHRLVCHVLVFCLENRAYAIAVFVSPFSLFAIVGGRDDGVAKQITVIGVKVLGNDGAGYITGILRGMDYVVYQRAITGRNSVINLSLGGIGASMATDRAVQNAFNSGIFVVGTCV
jgi:Subtilase family